MHELSIEGAARYSNYGGSTGGVWAYNVGAIWSPIRDIRFRGTYARSVRAPNLSNLHATPAVGFANNLTDPCDQPGGGNAGNNILAGPNRARNCAAAGVPTTLTYVDGSNVTVTIPWSNAPGSGVQGINQGNPNLLPEVGTSLTFGVVFQPRFLPGFSMTLDYYRIKITNVIAGLSGQSIINQCYDDPGGINNPYCTAVFRRTSPISRERHLQRPGRPAGPEPSESGQPLLGPAYLNQPFNFVAQKTSGIDLDMNYRTHIDANIVLNLRAIVSWVQNREQFTSVSAPTVSTRVLGLLGDGGGGGGGGGGGDFAAVHDAEQHAVEPVHPGPHRLDGIVVKEVLERNVDLFPVGLELGELGVEQLLDLDDPGDLLLPARAGRTTAPWCAADRPGGDGSAGSARPIRAPPFSLGGADQLLGAAAVARHQPLAEQAPLDQPADQGIDLALAGVEIADRRFFVNLGHLIGGGRLDAQHQRQEGPLMVGEIIFAGQWSSLRSIQLSMRIASAFRAGQARRRNDPPWREVRYGLLMRLQEGGGLHERQQSAEGRPPRPARRAQ